MPVINIVGELVALGPHRRDLLPTYQRRMNDLSTLRTLSPSSPRPATLEQQAAWYDAGPAEGEVRFTVYERASWRAVGTTELFEIDHHNRSASWGVLIGEPDCRGKGYGTETARLMLDYAFTVLGLHSVRLTVAAYNLAGQRAYAKAGFREIGRRRECRRLGDRLWDEVSMDCLATEFTSPVLGRVSSPDTPHTSPRSGVRMWAGSVADVNRFVTISGSGGHMPHHRICRTTVRVRGAELCSSQRPEKSGRRPPSPTGTLPSG